jgi:hypothetical protein
MRARKRRRAMYGRCGDRQRAAAGAKPSHRVCGELERGLHQRGLLKSNVPNFGRSGALSSMSEPSTRSEFAHATRVSAPQGGFHRRAASHEAALFCGQAAAHEGACRATAATQRAASRLQRLQKTSGEAGRGADDTTAQATARGLRRPQRVAPPQSNAGWSPSCSAVAGCGGSGRKQRTHTRFCHVGFTARACRAPRHALTSTAATQRTTRRCARATPHARRKSAHGLKSC